MKTTIYLYLDIETVPSKMTPDEPTLPLKPTEQDVKIGNRKPETAEAYRKEQLPKLLEEWENNCHKLQVDAELELRKESLDTLKGQIICIGYALDDSAPEIISGTEHDIIAKLENLIVGLTTGKQYLTTTSVGFNIKNFDFEWLLHRAIKYKRHKLYEYLRNCPMVELTEEFIFNKYNKKYYKFDDLLKFYGFTGKPDDIDGSTVFDYWVKGKNQKIYDYCANDIYQLRELHKLLMSMTS